MCPHLCCSEWQFHSNRNSVWNTWKYWWDCRSNIVFFFSSQSLQEDFGLSMNKLMVIQHDPRNRYIVAIQVSSWVSMGRTARHIYELGALKAGWKIQMFAAETMRTMVKLEATIKYAHTLSTLQRTMLRFPPALILITFCDVFFSVKEKYFWSYIWRNNNYLQRVQCTVVEQ